MVAAGWAAALVALAAIFWLGGRVFSGLANGASESERLALVARCLIGPGLALLAGVATAGNLRFFSAEAIEGTRTPSQRALEITLRYIQNTLEQTLLAAIAWAGLAVALPAPKLFLLPTLSVAFVVGRLTFWGGYLIHPMARAFGMVVTLLPTVIAYVWLTWRLFAR